MSKQNVNPTVLVVGSANVDVLLRVDRLPTRGETIAGGDLVRAVGGKGANQACAAAALGGAVSLIGCVGADDDGALVRRTLISASVDTSELRTAGDAPTGTALIFSAADGENLIGVAPGANARLEPEWVAQAIAQTTADHAVVLASLEVPLPAIVAAAGAARLRGFAFVLNPAPAMLLPADLLRQISVLTPNQHELAHLGHQTAAALIGAGAENVVVTRGAAGADIAATEAAPGMLVPAFPVDAVDSTGAGDAFNGGLAWALSSGYALSEAVRVGAAVGALATRGVGARSSLPTYDEVQELLRHSGSSFGL